MCGSPPWERPPRPSRPWRTLWTPRSAPQRRTDRTWRCPPLSVGRRGPRRGALPGPRPPRRWCARGPPGPGRPRRWRRCSGWWREWWCRGCPGPRTALWRGRRASGPSRARVRGRPRRRRGASLLLESVREGLGRALGAVHHVVHDGLRFLHVVIARFVDVLLDGTFVGVRPAAGVFTAHDALVVAPLDPALQLSGAQRVERMGAIERVEDLVDAVQRSARLLVFLGLHEERIQIHLLHVAAARHLQEHAERGLGVLAGEQAGAVRR